MAKASDFYGSTSAGIPQENSSTDNAVTRWKGNNGDAVQNSGVIVDDDDNISGNGQAYQTKGSDFTLSASEAGTTQECASGSAFTITVPTNANVTLPVGYTVTFIQGDGNAITFSGQSGVTINSKGGNTSTNGQWSAATIVKKATDAWALIGDLA